MTLTSDTVSIDANTDGSYKQTEGYRVRYYHPLAEKMAKHAFIQGQTKRGNMGYYKKHPNRWIGMAMLMYPTLLKQCNELLYEIARRIDNGDQGADLLKKFLQQVSELKDN